MALYLDVAAFLERACNGDAPLIAGVNLQYRSVVIHRGARDGRRGGAKDDHRFVISQMGPGTPITVVMNWPALVSK